MEVCLLIYLYISLEKINSKPEYRTLSFVVFRHSSAIQNEVYIHILYVMRIMSLCIL